RRGAGSRAPGPAHEPDTAARSARSRRAHGPPCNHRPARGASRRALARATGLTPFAAALEIVTRVRGVRGAMLVSAGDGLVVAEQLMEGIKGPAVAALAGSLANRL